MIAIFQADGRKELINSSAITRVREGSASSQYNGIRSYIHLQDGTVIECNQHVYEIEALLNKEAEK